MASPFYRLVLGVLCVWRITHLFYGEDGPWNLLARLRRRAGNGVWGGLLDCFNCVSLWIAAPFAYFLAEEWKYRLLLWPAFSGAAILLQRLTSREAQPPPALYIEGEERREELDREHVLRKE